MRSLRKHLPLLVALAVGALVAMAVSLSILGHPFLFGPDLLAFLHASERLMAGLPLYPPELVKGPIPVFILDAYLYPPTLAFLLVPYVALFGAGAGALAIWTIGSLAAFVASLVLGLRAGGRSPRSLAGALVLLAVGLWTFSSVGWVQGNISVSLGLAVAWALYAGPGASAGAALMASAVIKVAPVLLLPAALAAGGRRPFVGMAVSALVLVGIPFLVDPQAWFDSARVLLNLNASGAEFPLNLAPAAWLSAHLPGLAMVIPLVRMATLAGALAAMLWSIRVARIQTRDGWPFALALGVLAWLLVSPQLWFHYLVVLAAFEVRAICSDDPWARRAAWAAVILTPLAVLGPIAWLIIGLVLFATWRTQGWPVAVARDQP